MVLVMPLEAGELLGRSVSGGISDLWAGRNGAPSESRQRGDHQDGQPGR